MLTVVQFEAPETKCSLDSAQDHNYGEPSEDQAHCLKIIDLQVYLYKLHHDQMSFIKISK